MGRPGGEVRQLGIYSRRQASNRPAALSKAPSTMRKEAVSGMLASWDGGQSMNRPNAIKTAPKAWTTFHRSDMRRSVSLGDVSDVDSSIRVGTIGRCKHGDLTSRWSRRKSGSCRAFLPERMVTARQEIRKSQRESWAYSKPAGIGSGGKVSLTRSSSLGCLRHLCRLFSRPLWPGFGRR